MDTAVPPRKQGIFGGLLGRRAEPPAPSPPSDTPAGSPPAFTTLFGPAALPKPPPPPAAPPPPGPPAQPAAPAQPDAPAQPAAPLAVAPAEAVPDPIDFLCPRDLQREPPPAARVLAIGACFLETLVASPAAAHAGITFDFVLASHVKYLPAQPPADIAVYDFQIAQIPLRTIMHDRKFGHLDEADEAGYRDAFEKSCRALAQQVSARLRWTRDHGLPTFVLNFMVPQFAAGGRFAPRYDLRNVRYFVERLNQELERLVRATANAYVVDVDGIAASFGRRHIQDDSVTAANHGGVLVPDMRLADRLDPLGQLSDYYDLTPGLPFRLALLAEIQAMRTTLRQTDSVKLVVVDLDDTLWRGVAGDRADVGPEMLEGWPIGIIEALQALRKRGVLLGIISKNDEARVRALWDSIFTDRLHLADFAAIYINWRDKPANMRDLLKAVNLLPGNVVFVDDNPAERARMQAAFPQMRIIGGNPFTIRRILLQSPQTQVVSVTAESRDRTRMVQAQVQRESERAGLSAEDFARQQDIRLTLSVLRGDGHPKFPRAFELINKTNQFNTTGQRWTPEMCRSFFADGGWFAIYEVADRYTAYGLVGVMLISDASIVQWVMSCRVMGMGVEFAALGTVVDMLRAGGAAAITSRLVETAANQPCRHVYREAGFVDAVLGAEVVVRAPDHVKVEVAQAGRPS
jgi:FkbH-like protein